MFLACLAANAGAPSVFKAQPFDLREVRLLDGPFKHAMELDRQYLLSLDVDRLLHSFRVNAGLPSSAEPLGGWEELKSEVRGHFIGHYLSACALMYASTGDERLKEKGTLVVAGLAECQARIGTGYLSAFPSEFIDRVEAQKQVWAPYYTLHKLYAGLLDMHEYCGNQQALEVCKKFADWVIERNARLSDEQMQKMLGNEHGGMNETLANLYGITGQEKYLKIAQRFNHLAVIKPAAQKEDKLTGLHANTQIPKFVGTARQYELTGEEWLKTASKFFWETVVKERSYVIGGHSDGEMFTPKETLSTAFGPSTTETCNTYNMLKLTRHLFCWEPKAEYADYYERALINHILASQHPETGMMCYYVPLRSGSHKEYCTPTSSFWCCTGTGVENHAKYGDSIYFHEGNEALYVNLFIASELNWKAKGIKVRQETAMPEGYKTTLTFTCERPTDLTVKIRYPGWAWNCGINLNESRVFQEDPDDVYPAERDITNLPALVTRLQRRADDVSAYLWQQLHPKIQELITNFNETASDAQNLKKSLAVEMHLKVSRKEGLDKQQFKDIRVSPETEALFRQKESLGRRDLEKLRRKILEDAYPEAFRKMTFPGSYFTISRQWKTGDQITFIMSSHITQEGFSDNSNRIAFLHGPTVLCAEVDPKKPTPVFVPGNGYSAKAVTNHYHVWKYSPGAFRTFGETEDMSLTLEPFYKMHGPHHYAVYFDRLAPEQWETKQAEFKAEQARQKELEARTVDAVQLGDPAAEKAHALQGERTRTGPYQNRHWRDAHEGGWFSYELKVLPDQPLGLQCEFWGSDAGSRTFDILIDGQKIATQTLQNNRPGEFFYQEFPLSPDAMRGKERIVVKFQAHPGQMAGGVFGLRILRPPAK